MKNCPKKVEMKFHYSKDDEDCSGDFYNAEIYFDGVAVLSLTDEYHDNTNHQFKGFLAACSYFFEKDFPKEKVTNKNDSKY